jgi:phosphoserine aminotransferase
MATKTRRHEMISFYPGPSRVYDEIPRYVKDAHKHGILSLNHRSPEFEELSKRTIALLKEKLNIPRNYTILYASSATECWEMIAQSLVIRESIHLYNGAFGEKWFDYTRRLHEGSTAVAFDRDALLDPEKLIFKSGEVICFTQNETSNGTQVSNAIIAAAKKNNPNHLIAVDATSSMAGVRLTFTAADVWFASVQKCFGLPAGLSIMVVSPKGIERIRQINEARHYDSLAFMTEMMAKWQTPCTPNVLGIYLMMRTLQARGPIGQVHKEIKQRADDWHVLLQRSKTMQSMIRNPAVRSQTVIAVKAEASHIEKIKKEAHKKGFLLGEGYGALKKETFRIANFPALKGSEVARLMKFLSQF